MSRFLSKSLTQLTPYVPGEQPQDQQYIKLNTNESPFPPSPLVVEGITKKQIEDLRLYSDPELKQLITAVAEYCAVPNECVFCGNGSDEVLSFAFRAWGSDCGVAFADITYGFYRVFADFYGIDIKVIPLCEDFTINPADYENCGRMIVLANPNAPTGLLLPLDAIRTIAQSNPKKVVIVDEAYIDFGGQSALPLLDVCKNLLVVRTFSKSRQLAGARLGFAVGAPELIDDLNRLKFSFNPYNVNRLTALAGTLAIKDNDWFEKCCNDTIQTRQYITEQLRKRGFIVLDSATNFVFAKCDGISGQDYYKKLKQKGILVRHFSQERIADYVRITIGTKEEMEILLQKTDEILKEANA